MILHIGSDMAVHTRHILAILDLKTSASRDTAAFLKNAPAPGAEMKSAVVLEREGKVQIWYSPISASTLQKRSELTGG